MPGVYLDTSALGRVLLGEPDSAAVVAALPAFDEHISSRLLRIELRRLAFRYDLLADVDRLLGAVALVPISDAILEAAETIPPRGIATLDAIHLVTALRLAEQAAVEALITFDVRLAEAARQHGLDVIVPA